MSHSANPGDRQIVIDKLRALVDRYNLRAARTRDSHESTRAERSGLINLENEAAAAVVEAYRYGFLNKTGMSELVEWFTAKDKPPPFTVPPNYARAGCNFVDALASLLPEWHPNLYPRIPIEWPTAKPDERDEVAREDQAKRFERCAETFRVLASLIQSGQGHIDEGVIRCSHSPDFTSVNVPGTHYEFSKGNQAESVRVLWQACSDGRHSLSQETIGVMIGSSAQRFQLCTLFRKRNPDHKYTKHPAWGTLIKAAGRGVYRLDLPESSS